MSLLILHHDQLTLYVLVYANNILIIGSDASAITRLISTLGRDFPIKDLGSLSFFLGIEVHHSLDGIILSQKCYINDLLCQASISSAKSVASSLATSTQLSVLLVIYLMISLSVAAWLGVSSTSLSLVQILPSLLARFVNS